MRHISQVMASGGVFAFDPQFDALVATRARAFQRHGKHSAEYRDASRAIDAYIQPLGDTSQGEETTTSGQGR